MCTVKAFVILCSLGQIYSPNTGQLEENRSKRNLAFMNLFKRIFSIHRMEKRKKVFKVHILRASGLSLACYHVCMHVYM